MNPTPHIYPPDSSEKIVVQGAREHNLQNIDLEIPRNQLTVITGLSGSGKSSLAFDTLYAEGQRRYIETFSAYARQFLGGLERPDVDKITGLSPVISIEQKTTNKNPRSTVGTITELYDFLRLLYARIGEAFSYETGERMVRYTDERIIELILEQFANQRTIVLAPLVKGRKGHYKELFEQLRKKGFLQARIDGQLTDLVPGLKLDRYKNHNIELVIDKLQVAGESKKRLRSSVETAMHQGKGILMLWHADTDLVRYYSRQLMCPTTGLSYNEPSPHSFSFNSPVGSCPKCKGLGYVNELDIDSIIPDRNKSIAAGGIEPLGKESNTMIFWLIEAIGKRYGFTLKTPIGQIPEEALDIILNGSDEKFTVENQALGRNTNYALSFDGVVYYIRQQSDASSKKAQKWSEQFVKTIQCPACEGKRLKRESLHFRIAERDISELAQMDARQLADWFAQLPPLLNAKQQTIARDILKEINTRLGFLLEVGLDYLSLDRSAKTLSGGESQRIRLATQIGSRLVNVLYILDEPSIGLHQRDNHRLIEALKDLRDTGNSVVVVEHDRDMILAADYVIDMGPQAGRHGGQVVAAGPPEKIRNSPSLTAQYLSHTRSIATPTLRRPGNGHHLVLRGARGHNLRGVDVSIPLGSFVCITGVSGSGKSSLINGTLQPILSQHFYQSVQDPLPYDSCTGLEHIDKVIEVDQSPIGRTPRSNPATYTNIFADIRNLFAVVPEAKIRGYKPGRFSFNVSGGRCETCGGAGLRTIEMNFLPDVYVHCEDCNGKRYNRETLEVRFKGKSISDVLDMTIHQAVEFFDGIPSIAQKLKAIEEVGLGYLTLGQPSTTLSGGEAQRIKLATELARKSTGRTFYIFDEPTTGLHFEDVRVLLEVLHRIVDRGNTVVVVEHNMDVIKTADYIIDIGPEGGVGGGQIVCAGTPEQVAAHPNSYTGQYLQHEL